MGHIRKATLDIASIKPKTFEIKSAIILQKIFAMKQDADAQQAMHDGNI